ncbi:MAG: putative 4-hydroxybenzoate polyprenyltransferase [Kiritimatiellales bacterium]|nr:putative 4-hydroxybenzoate polyprenyltransferase [Kiritimatiellales bacterium]
MIGILFATMEEARPFLSRGLAVQLSEKPFHVYQLENSAVVIISGMGRTVARKAAGELIEKGATSIINAGVCGALVDDVERGTVFCVSSAINADEASSLVAFERKDLFPSKRLVTVDRPVFQPDRKKTLSEFGELVDMEGHAVAEVCAERNVPCIMLKGVTDFGDHNGKEDIQRHIAPVSGKVADAVFQCLENQPAETSNIWKKLHSFTKVEHTIFSLPLLFAGAWLGAGGRCPPISKLALIALVGLGARTFGMAANRILDRNIDAKNPRTKNRELPSGKLSMAQGVAVALVGLAIYFIGCTLLGTTVLKLSLVPLVPLTLYSLLKRFTILCHFGIGLCLALAPLGAFVAVTNGIAFSSEVLLITLFTFCWMSGNDIIYALLDIESDRTVGIHSIPAAFGAVRAQWIAAATHLVAIATLLILVDGLFSGIAAAVSIAAFAVAYLPSIPVHVRFFPIFAIAGIAGAFVVILGA